MLCPQIAARTRKEKEKENLGSTINRELDIMLLLFFFKKRN
jgi:hypothetical protein